LNLIATTPDTLPVPLYIRYSLLKKLRVTGTTRQLRN
jgi:hypothetical protein